MNSGTLEGQATVDLPSGQPLKAEPGIENRNPSNIISIKNQEETKMEEEKQQHQNKLSIEVSSNNSA